MQKTKNALLILAGCVICGLAYAMFLIPHHFVPGGVSGLAMIGNYFSGLPVGALIIVLNVPVFLLGLRTMGKKYVLSSLAGMVVSSVFIDLFNKVLKLPSATDNPVLASIYGGVMLGVGLGIVFRGRSSTGGSDIIGMVISKYAGVSLGFGIMITDFIIISASGFIMRSLEAPLYGYIVLFLSTKVIDLVLEGWSYSKLVIITSSRTDEIADYILHGLDRSGTALRSRSLYLNREGEIILTVIHRKQLADLRTSIRRIDPEAFVIINDTYDVLGKGFKSHLIT
ncbi:MAG TPA: YitT family protein [Candidatus Aminicenantes bacterium]|nr:YitT family protein [Candidatus Aminicenantes bacterium]HRY65595.1 YitT family protein [Candidatus Aminicenantes bacterium]HRZ72517.1 YitT family protein [Candidatus Aminicenantes bacterium]